MSRRVINYRDNMPRVYVRTPAVQKCSAVGAASYTLHEVEAKRGECAIH